MSTKRIPKRLQAVLWSTDINQLDLQKNRGYIIHNILRFGTFADIKWLFKIYSSEKIKDIFLHHPSKNYAEVDYYFVKNYILGLKGRTLDKDAYVTSIHGPVRPRATTGI